MKKEYVGIHLGKRFLSAARVENKTLVAFTKLSLSSLKEESGNKMLQDNILWEVMINKVLKEVSPEYNEVFVTLEDGEFIFRNFDMPLMKKKEIESSMNYEIEKYIPFKIEELVWDYAYTKIPKYKKIDLSFVGIKSTSYKKYKKLFANTNAVVLNIEPSAISLARVVKSLKFAQKINNFAMLDFPEGESYITFFYNNLPVFNRFIGSFGGDESKGLSIDKLIEEVIISIQYFRREFKNYNLNSLFILCDSEKADLLSTLKNRVDIDSKVIVPDDILGGNGLRMEHFKAYAAATVSMLPFRFKPKFQSKEELAGGKKKRNIDIPPLNYALITLIFIAGAVACVFFYSLLNNKVIAEKYKLKRKMEKLALPESLKNKPISEIKSYLNRHIQEENGAASRLKDDFVEYSHVYPILNEFPKILSNGLWLSDFCLTRDDKGKLSLTLSGYVLVAGKNGKEGTINEFISSIKNSSIMHRYFMTINPVSIGRVKVEGYEAVSFSLKLK